VTWSWAISGCVLCTSVPSHGILLGVVAERALSVTTNSRTKAMMWPATKSHPKWRCMPTNEALSIDQLRAPKLFPLVLFLSGGYTLVTSPRIVTPYRDSVDGTDSVTYRKLVTR